MNLINCTPHPVNLILQGETKNIPASGIIPRLQEEIKNNGMIDSNIPLFSKKMAGVENLPEKKEGTFLIVSSLIATSCPERDDLLVPNIVRDDTGKIIGCNGFFQIVSDDFEIL